MVKREYKPAPTVMAFMLSQAFVRLIRGPVGSGKSTGCLYEIARQAKMQERGVGGKRRSRWAVIRNTRQQLMDTTYKSFVQLFPDGVAGRWRAQDMTFIMEFEDVVAEVMFRALDTPDDVKRLLSLELTGAFVNEAREMDESIFNALKGRVGRYPSKMDGGCTHPCIMLDTNAPDEDTWLYDLEMNPPDNMEVFVQPPAFLPGTRQINPRAENLENLPPQYYENMADGVNEEFIKVYIRNEFGTTRLGKPVWPMFKTEYHVSKNILLPNPHLKLIIGADAGLTPAARLMQLDLHGRLMILDELDEEDMGSKRFISERLKPLLKNKYDNCDTLVAGDPAMKERSQGDEKTVAGFYKEAGFKLWTPKSNRLPARLGAVESFLMRMTEGGPGFQVSPHCKTTIRAMKGGYRFALKRATGESVGDTAPEKNKFSHGCDALQYGSMYFEDEKNSRVGQHRGAQHRTTRSGIPGLYSGRR